MASNNKVHLSLFFTLLNSLAAINVQVYYDEVSWGRELTRDRDSCTHPQGSQPTEYSSLCSMLKPYETNNSHTNFNSNAVVKRFIVPCKLDFALSTVNDMKIWVFVTKF